MPIKNTFAIIGRGFIYPKHKEAIESIGGEVLDECDGLDWWGRMIKNTKAEWVVILTPNDWHYKMSLIARMNNKKVLCEKPLTLCEEKTKELIGYGDVYTVYQLRYLPEIQKLKEEVRESDFYNIKLNMSVHRSQEYFDSWKGNKSVSGGLLFNTGIHYFDLIVYIFGYPDKFKTEKYAEERAEGWLEGKNYRCDWVVDLLAPEDKQERSFTINNKAYDLFTKENLHKKLYQALVAGEGITAQDALPSIRLVEQLSK